MLNRAKTALSSLRREYRIISSVFQSPVDSLRTSLWGTV